MRGAVGSSGARVLISVIQLYRNMVSPLRLPTCRFTPTCSQYAVDALSEYGLLKGGWLAIVRLLKCGPWHRGGWDPIPERGEAEAEWRADADEHREGRGVGVARDGSGVQVESETRV